MDKITIIGKKDLKIEWFTSPGNGGQHKNKRQTACRMTHMDSGVTVQSTEHREANQNLKAAFTRLCRHPLVKIWLARKIQEIRSGKSIEDRVEEAMQSRHLKVEGIQDGQWVQI